MAYSSDDNTFEPGQLADNVPATHKTECRSGCGFIISLKTGSDFAEDQEYSQSNFRVQSEHHCEKSHCEPDLHHAMLRIFVCDISERINNLLMGIWGNVTLIRMLLSGGRRGENRALALETTIQNNAYFIQLLLGYFAERRAPAKSIRLNQLYQEISNNRQIADAYDLKLLWPMLKSADSSNSATWIAGILVYVLDPFLKKISSECHLLALCSKEAKGRAEKIELLMQHGSGILRQLRLFAGELQPKAGRVRLNHLLKKQARKIQHDHEGLILDVRLEPKLPEIWADREQLQWVLKQVIDSAVSTMHPDAQLALCASYPASNRDCHPSAEKTTQRAGVLITIKETRKPEKYKLADVMGRLSDTLMRRQYIGLPMAAAGCIARKHGGDLQVASDPHGCRLCTITWPAAISTPAKDRMPATASPSDLTTGQIRMDHDENWKQSFLSSE